MDKVESMGGLGYHSVSNERTGCELLYISFQDCLRLDAERLSQHSSAMCIPVNCPRVLFR
jgi:hypothetical protein